MNIIEVKNCQYTNAENTLIACEALFDAFDVFIPFAASASDIEAHGVEIFNRAVAGEFGDIAAFVPAPAQIPQSVSMRQAKLALLQAGLLLEVNTAISQADPAIQIEWEYATEVPRNWPTIQAMQDALGLTDLQLDELFTLAATL